MFESGSWGHSVLQTPALVYDINLNTQDFVYMEFVKYQLGRRRNMLVLCNVCISTIQLFYIQHVQTVVLYQNKLYIFPIVELANFLYWNPYYLK